jgi:plasmid stabilization system protein ParE
MAKEVVWTLRSIQDRISISQFWTQHNKSNSYSRKLEHIFQVAANLLSKFPDMGSPTKIPGVRIKIVRTFKVFYQANEKSIVILRIWDSRQNPENLKVG